MRTCASGTSGFAGQHKNITHYFIASDHHQISQAVQMYPSLSGADLFGNGKKCI